MTGKKMHWQTAVRRVMACLMTVLVLLTNLPIVPVFAKATPAKPAVPKTKAVTQVKAMSPKERAAKVVATKHVFSLSAAKSV